MKAPAYTTMTVIENGVMYYFRLIPLMPVMEFLEKVGALSNRKDVNAGEVGGFWKVVA